MQVLIVEDEEKIADIIRKGLLTDLYNADIARNGEEALEKFTYNSYDFVILDVMLPQIDGLTLCLEIRKKNRVIPILILTAKDDVSDKIAGLDAGADDYVTKPFAYAEISARMRALLRRGNKADPVILTIADITLDPATKVVTRNKHTISLTAREFALLEYLMRNQHIVLTKSQILEHVWDYQYEGLSNIVETYIKYLRKKLKVYPHAKEVIHTVRGTGYCLRI